MRSSHFLDMMRRQERWRLEESVNLLPSENMASPQLRALLSSDFGHRYTLPIEAESGGVYIENGYRGSRLTTLVERDCERAACEVYGSRYACVQPMGGHIAAMIAIASTTQKGGSVYAIPVENGGYDGYAQPYLPDILGLKAGTLPFDSSRQNIDTEATASMIRRKRPGLVILGASFILFPYDMGPVRDACEDAGSKLAYDGSHVMGLIAGGEFQRPLKEGADLLYGSTHKSLFGPQGGMILTDSKAIDGEVRKNLTWRFVDNVHWNRVAALGQAMLEMRRFGPAYAKQVVRSSRRLGKELDERGFPIMYRDLGYSSSHQLHIDQAAMEERYGLDMNGMSIRLERSNLITDSVGRLGTSEITRLGVKEKHLPELADMFVDAAKGRQVRKRVKAFRDRFTMDYRFR
ncbi:MAG: serine hydroxymethyltransferase [Candidatus Thermoplasmatota archaeon]